MENVLLTPHTAGMSDSSQIAVRHRTARNIARQVGLRPVDEVITGPDQMKREVLGHLRFMQKSPDLIRSFFLAPSTAYTA
jgi:hypothetical protein